MIKKIPLRKCTGCLEMKDKRSLLRIVKSSSHSDFFIDLSGKASGRGAYICNNINCFEKAFKNKGLERSFKSPIPKHIYENIRNELITND